MRQFRCVRVAPETTVSVPTAPAARARRPAHPRSPSTSSGVARILGARIMKFCNQCGAPVRLRVPEGDTLPRYVCEACGTIHYQNPRLVVGCVPEHEGRILLCRRAIEAAPRLLDGSRRPFLENWRDAVQQAAARESLEEALAEVTVAIAAFQWCTCCTRSRFTCSSAPACRRRATEPGRRASRSVLVKSRHQIPWADMVCPSRGADRLRYAAPLPRGPGGRPRAASLHDHRPAPAAGLAGADSPRAGAAVAQCPATARAALLTP